MPGESPVSGLGVPLVFCAMRSPAAFQDCSVPCFPCGNHPLNTKLWQIFACCPGFGSMCEAPAPQARLEVMAKEKWEGWRFQKCGGKGWCEVRLSWMSWDENVGGREALSSSQQKIQGCGPWVRGVEVAQGSTPK